MKDPINFNSFLLPVHLGGLSIVSSHSTETNGTGFVVESAKSLRLIFVLDCSDDQKKELASIWENGALQAHPIKFGAMTKVQTRKILNLNTGLTVVLTARLRHRA